MIEEGFFKKEVWLVMERGDGRGREGEMESKKFYKCKRMNRRGQIR